MELTLDLKKAFNLFLRGNQFNNRNDSSLYQAEPIHSKFAKIKALEDLKLRKKAIDNEIGLYIKKKEVEFIEKTQKDFTHFFSNNGFELTAQENMLCAIYGDLRIVLKYSNPYVAGQEHFTITVSTQSPAMVKEFQVFAYQNGLGVDMERNYGFPGMNNERMIEQETKGLKNYIVEAEKQLTAGFKKFSFVYECAEAGNYKPGQERKNKQYDHFTALLGSIF